MLQSSIDGWGRGSDASSAPEIFSYKIYELQPSSCDILNGAITLSEGSFFIMRYLPARPIFGQIVCLNYDTQSVAQARGIDQESYESLVWQYNNKQMLLFTDILDFIPDGHKIVPGPLLFGTKDEAKAYVTALENKTHEHFFSFFATLHLVDVDIPSTNPDADKIFGKGCARLLHDFAVRIQNTGKLRKKYGH